MALHQLAMNRNALLVTNLIMGAAVLASGRGHAGIRPSSERGHTEAHKEESNMLTVFMTGCSAAADWQSLGLYYSFIRYFHKFTALYCRKVSFCSDLEQLQDLVADQASLGV